MTHDRVDLMNCEQSRIIYLCWRSASRSPGMVNRQAVRIIPGQGTIYDLQGYQMSAPGV